MNKIGCLALFCILILNGCSNEIRETEKKINQNLKDNQSHLDVAQKIDPQSISPVIAEKESIPVNKDIDLLQEKASQAEYGNNLKHCLSGIGVGCNHALLSQEEAAQVKQAEYGNNLKHCLSGIGVGCNYALLSQEEAGQVRQAESQLKIKENKLDGGYYEYKPAPITTPVIGCAENGSCYGDISKATGAPKTISVKGYHRADGTYVRGHYRSRR